MNSARMGDEGELERLRTLSAELRIRAHEAEETIAAIRNGDVDALIVGDDVYTLDSANAASNAMRRDVLAQMQDAVLASDRDGNLIFMNPAAEVVYGRNASDMLGRPRDELYLELWAAPEDAELASTALQAHGAYRAESVHRRHDALEMHVESTVSRLRGAGGETIGTLFVIRDITERARTDAALRESKAQLEFTLAAARVGEWEIDVHTGACRHSALFDRCFGLDVPVIPWNLDVMLARIHDEDRERVRDLVEESFRTQRRLAFECRVLWPDGGVHWIEVQGSAHAQTTRDGAQLRYLGIISDITERKHAEAALRDADVRKDEFLATLAHELRNPLAPIRNAVQLMKLSREERVQDNARLIIDRQLKQLVHIVDDLLDINRISQGKIELRRENIDVATAVMTAVETSRPLIEAGHHALSIHLAPPRSLRVNADLTRLSQIVANLLNNAAKYTPEGGRIEVTTERDGAHALIRVRDSGIGIPSEMLPHVFEMFAQVERSKDRAQGGLGIGLALVKRLVEMHGGSVSAASDGPDRGSCFTISLPTAQDWAEPAPIEPSELVPGNTRRQRILVVDDNHDSAESLSEVLGALGYDTSIAHDGVEAIEAVRSQSPEIVLLDIGMPRMNGLEAARRIRQLPGGDRVTLVALSGWGQDEDRHRSREASFDHHFVKPLDIQALIDVIEKLPAR